MRTPEERQTKADELHEEGLDAQASAGLARRRATEAQKRAEEFRDHARRAQKRTKPPAST